MAKEETGIQATSLFNEIMTQQHINAKDRAREAFVLDRLHRGEISTNRAARLLNVSQEELSELMYTIKTTSPLLV